MATTRKTTKKEERTPTWTDVRGQMHVMGFDNEYKRNGKKVEFTTWSTSIGRKFDDDKDWTNFRVNVFFAESCGAPEESGPHDIMVEKGFWSLERFQTKAGDTVVRPKIIITEYSEDV